MNSGIASVETDLLADWRFNVGEGNILYDHSGNGNHGSINGASWETDVPELPILPVPGGNNSLRFDGADDYVDTGIPYTAFSGATALKFEFTFMQSSGHDDGQHQGLITSQSSGNTQIGIRLSDQNYLEFGFKDDNSGFSTAYLDSVIQPERWYPVKIVLENNQVQWFLNCLLYTSPSPRDATLSRMPSSA